MIIYMEGLDLTLSILPREGLSNPGLMMNRMAALQQNSGIIGRSTPSALDPRDVHRAAPSGHLSGIGDGFPNTSHVLTEHGYILG